MRYKAYKEVDLPWVEEIPEHWGIGRIKSLCENFYSGGTPTAGDSNYYTDTGEDYFLNISDLNSLYGINKAKKRLTKEGIRSKNLRKVNTGNIVYAMYASVGKVGVLEVDLYISQAFLSFKAKNIQTDYLKYYLYSLENFIPALTNSSTQKNLNAEIVKNIVVLVPTKKEQEKIAKFLDWKINEIDRLIFNKEEKINKLQKIRNWYLDKTFGVRVKLNIENSDIKFVKIKFLCDVITNKSGKNKPFIGLENIESSTGKILNQIDELPLKSEGIDVSCGMVIFGKLRPYLAKVYAVKNEASCSSEFLVLKPSKRINNEFLKYVLLSPIFIELVDSSTYGAKMPRANTDFITSIFVEAIDHNEQKEIVKKTEGYLGKIENYRFNLQSEIHKLHNLKLALISEVVTGKIDVQNIEIPEYEKVESAIEEENIDLELE